MEELFAAYGIVENTVNENAEPRVPIGAPDELKLGESRDLFSSPLFTAIVSGYYGIVKLLLQHPFIEINPIVLCAAVAIAARNYDDVLELLIRSEKVSIANIFDPSIFINAAFCNKYGIIDAILHKPGVDVNMVDDGGNSMFLIAAVKGHTEIMKLIISTHKEVLRADHVDNDGKTALYYAAANGHLEAVKIIIESDLGVDINFTNGDAGSALSAAIAATHKNVAEYLLSQPNVVFDLSSVYRLNFLMFAFIAQMMVFPMFKNSTFNPPVDFRADKVCASGETLLHAAAFVEDQEMIRILLDQFKVDPNAADKDGRSPLWYCLGQEQSFKMLFHHPDVNINLRSKSGTSILRKAVELKNRNIVRCFLEDERMILDEDMFADAMRTDDVEMLQIYLRRQGISDLRSSVLDGVSFLEWCCGRSLWNLVKWILDGTDIDPNNVLGGVPVSFIVVLMRNNAGEQINIFKSLISCKRFDVNQKESRYDLTLLEWLMAKNDKAHIITLLECAYDRVDFGCHSPNPKWLPLEYAIFSNDARILDLVFHHPTLSDVNELLSDGHSYLQDAILRMNVVAVRLLLSKPELKMDVHFSVDFAIASENNNVLHLAAFLSAIPDALEILKLLLEDPRTISLIDETNSIGATPLIHACVLGNDKAVALFLQKGSSVTKVANDMRPPLIAAISSKNNAVVDLLLKSPDIEVNAGGALNFAISSKHSYAVAALMNHPDFIISDGDFLANLVFSTIVASSDSVDPEMKKRLEKMAAQSMNPLYSAVSANNVAAVDAIIDFPRKQFTQETYDSAIKVASLLGYTEVLGCFISKRLINPQKEDEYIDKYGKTDRAKSRLYYAKALSLIREEKLDAAESALKKCVDTFDNDFQATSLFVAISLHQDRTKLDKVHTMASTYARTMFHYHGMQFDEAQSSLADLAVTIENSNSIPGVLVLKALVQVRSGRYTHAWTTYKQLETVLQQREDNRANDSATLEGEEDISNYSMLSKYVLGLLLFRLGKYKMSYQIMREAFSMDRRFIEPLIVCAEILYNAGLKDGCEKIIAEVTTRVTVLPLIEKNTLLELQDRMTFDRYLAEQQQYQEQFDMKSKELDEKLAKLVANSSSIEARVGCAREDILHRWSFDYVRSKIKSLVGAWTESLITRECSINFPKVEYLGELVDSEKIIPMVSKWDKFKNSIRTKPPHLRKRSAEKIPVTVAMTSNHSALEALQTDIDELKRLRSRIPAHREALRLGIRQLEKLLRQKVQQDNHKAFLREELAIHERELRLLEESSCALDASFMYLENCRETFLMRYGANSPYHLTFDKAYKYWIDLTTQLYNRTISFEHEDTFTAPERLLSVGIQNYPRRESILFLDGYDKHLPDSTALERGAYNDKERDNNEKTHLYQRFVFDHQRLNVANSSAHYVFRHDDVYFKLTPYAPGIEFSVNSLNRLLLEELAVPTRLIRIEGHSIYTWGKVAHYQASISVPGCSFDKMLANNPKYIDLIDLKSFSSLLISSLLVGTGDCKPDNLIAQVVFDEKDPQRRIKSIKLIDIDKDISFCSGRLGFRKLSQTSGKLFSDFLNTLFFLPQMDQPVHNHIREVLTKGPYRVEELIASWLHELYEQNRQYEALVTTGIFTPEDMTKLKLPIKLRKAVKQKFTESDLVEINFPGTAVAIYERLLRMHALFNQEGEVTHSWLLREFYPGISTYYEMKREALRQSRNQDIIQSIKQLYIEASDDIELKRDLKFHDRIRSTAAWQTISSRKMLDEALFRERFNGTIPEIAEEFLESIDFSRFDADVRLLGVMLMRNLYFVSHMQLRNMRCFAGYDQFTNFFVGLQEDSTTSSTTSAAKRMVIDPSSIQLKAVELIDMEEKDIAYCKNTTMYRRLLQLGINVTFPIPNKNLSRQSSDATTDETGSELGSNLPSPGRNDPFELDFDAPTPASPSPSLQHVRNKNNPAKAQALQIALLHLFEHAHQVELVSNVKLVVKKIQEVVDLVKDSELLDLSYLNRVSKDDAALCGGVEQPESVMFQFSMMLLEYPSLLLQVGHEMAKKGAFTNNHRLLISMIHHRDANRFASVIKHIIQTSPAILSDVDETRAHIGDHIFHSQMIRSDVKEHLYCVLVNTFGLFAAKEFIAVHDFQDDGEQATRLLDEMRIFSAETVRQLGLQRRHNQGTTSGSSVSSTIFSSLKATPERSKIEQDKFILLCLSPAFGFPVQADDWKRGGIDFTRRCCDQCGMTWLHRLAMSRNAQPFHRKTHPHLCASIATTEVKRVHSTDDKKNIHGDIHDTSEDTVTDSERKSNQTSVGPVENEETDGFVHAEYAEDVMKGLYAKARRVLLAEHQDEFTDPKWLDAAMWQQALYLNKDIWEIALFNYHAEVLADVYRYWNGLVRRPPVVLPTISVGSTSASTSSSADYAIGVCTFIPSMSSSGCFSSGRQRALDVLRRVSRYFNTVGWEFTTADAWLLDIPQYLEDETVCLQRIRQFLNTRVDPTGGNSLLHAMVTTLQSRFHEIFGHERTKYMCIEDVLVLGGDPLFTKRRDKLHALAVAKNQQKSADIVSLLERFVVVPSSNPPSTGIVSPINPDEMPTTTQSTATAAAV